MTYIVKSYTDLSDVEKNKFYEFCKNASTEVDDPASKNMWNKDIDANWTVIYKLEKTDTFNEPNGKFFVLFYDEMIVGCSGVYQSPFDPKVYIAGVRTWINKDHRHQSLNKKYFFPIQRQWVIDNNGKIVALTFNRYNKNIIEIFKRNRLGETAGRTSNRNPNELFYKGFNELEFPVWLHNTKQWVCFEMLDSEFTYDWTTIKYNAEKHF